MDLVKRRNRLRGAPLEGARRERWTSVDDVKRGNSLGGAPLEGARRERRTSVDGL